VPHRNVADLPDGYAASVPGAVLIPIKSFDLAKGRLAASIEPANRSTLAMEMAAAVIRAARDLPVWVVCGDHTVADFAREHGADVIWREPNGLNRAIADGTADLAARGFDRAIIAHADLPLATDLTFLDGDLGSDLVMLVPDRRDDGSNVLSIPLGRGFEFHYGPGSARAHRAEAERCGLPVRTINDERLCWDIDVPDDLASLPNDLLPDHVLSDHLLDPRPRSDRTHLDRTHLDRTEERP